MSDINNQNMLQVGTVLHGTYRIESYLSSGGFGNTYIAKNIEFNETYAIKEFFVIGVCQRDSNSTTISVSNTENTSNFEQQREKFKKEARRLRSLNNPHIVKVYDLFEENGTAYYVMDYVDGENLSTRLKRTQTPLPETTVRNYLTQILDGLEAIHAAGIWHLDIKPANIIVDAHDVIKLIDFGASKQQSTAGGATASTGISYTNGYAPSEQMAQSYDKFGPWTDFYALGATLFKLLTNQDPPSVTDLSEDETEDKHLALPMPHVSEEMKKLVVWMMQVNRLKRPKNVGEVRGFLQQFSAVLTSNNEETKVYSQYQSSANSVSDDEKTVLAGEVEKDNLEVNETEENTDDDSSTKKARFIVIFLLGFVVVCFIFMSRGCGNSTVANTIYASADSDSVYFDAGEAADSDGVYVENKGESTGEHFVDTFDGNTQPKEGTKYDTNGDKRQASSNIGVYATEDELTPGYYQIHNVPLLSTESHRWGLTSMIVKNDCTILHKWCIPKVNGTFVCSTADEFIEDAQTHDRYYIMKSDIGIGLKNKLILTDTKLFMFTEWYPSLPSSVRIINIYNGSQYIVRNLRLK